MINNLAEHLSNMKRIFWVMTTFSLAMGLAFPLAVDPFVTWDPQKKLYFRIACLAAGFFVGGFCFLLVRITIFQQNQVLAIQKAKEEKARAEWETSFNSLSEGVVVVDSHGVIIHANQSFSAMLGFQTNNLIGKAAIEIARKRGWGEKCLLELAMQSGEHMFGESTNNGSTFEQTANPVRNDKGEIVGCVGVLRDVTEDRRLRQDLIQTEKMATVGRLVSGAAHELNNPLTGVTALTELILRRELDKSTRQDLESILKEGNRAVHIVANLLSFVRQNKTRPVPLDPNRLLSETLELKAYDLKKAGVEVNVNQTRFPFSIVADPIQLKQVFINMIDNSIDSMSEKDDCASHLTVSVEPRDHALRMHFVDNGPGVPDEVRDHIFDPFFTTRDIGQGTGLGLSVCFGIIEEHGGHIWLEEDGAPGAHFVVEIPVTATAAA